MQPDFRHSTATNNRLLAALPPREYKRLLPNLEEVALEFNTNIYNLGDTISYVYFPISCVISLMAAVGDSSILEVGIVGSEGMVGLPLCLGVKTSHSRAVVRGDGMAMRMKATDFENELRKVGALPGMLLRFAHSWLVQVSQTGVCYRFHRLEKRLARGLLMISDRMGSNEFQMTHDFLSHMLGVRREAVTGAAGALRKGNLISYSHGHILIIDRPGLEAAACKCYGFMRDEEMKLTAVN